MDGWMDGRTEGRTDRAGSNNLNMPLILIITIN